MQNGDSIQKSLLAIDFTHTGRTPRQRRQNFLKDISTYDELSSRVSVQQATRQEQFDMAKNIVDKWEPVLPVQVRKMQLRSSLGMGVVLIGALQTPIVPDSHATTSSGMVMEFAIGMAGYIALRKLVASIAKLGVVFSWRKLRDLSQLVESAQA